MPGDGTINLDDALDSLYVPGAFSQYLRTGAGLSPMPAQQMPSTMPAPVDSTDLWSQPSAPPTGKALQAQYSASRSWARQTAPEQTNNGVLLDGLTYLHMGRQLTQQQRDSITAWEQASSSKPSVFGSSGYNFAHQQQGVGSYPGQGFRNPSSNPESPEYDEGAALENQITSEQRANAKSSWFGRALSYVQQAQQNGNAGAGGLGLILASHGFQQMSDGVYGALGQAANLVQGGPLDAVADAVAHQNGRPLTKQERMSLESTYGSAVAQMALMGADTAGAMGSAMSSIGREAGDFAPEIAGGVTGRVQRFANEQLPTFLGKDASLAASRPPAIEGLLQKGGGAMLGGSYLESLGAFMDPTSTDEERGQALHNAFTNTAFMALPLLDAATRLPYQYRANYVMDAAPSLKGNLQPGPVADILYKSIRAGADPRDIEMAFDPARARANYNSIMAAQQGAQLKTMSEPDVQRNEQGAPVGMTVGAYNRETGAMPMWDVASGGTVAHEITHAVEARTGINEDWLRQTLGDAGFEKLRQLTYDHAASHPDMEYGIGTGFDRPVRASYDSDEAYQQDAQVYGHIQANGLSDLAAHVSAPDEVARYWIHQYLDDPTNLSGNPVLDTLRRQFRQNGLDQYAYTQIPHENAVQAGVANPEGESDAQASWRRIMFEGSNLRDAFQKELDRARDEARARGQANIPKDTDVPRDPQARTRVQYRGGDLYLTHPEFDDWNQINAEHDQRREEIERTNWATARDRQNAIGAAALQKDRDQGRISNRVATREAFEGQRSSVPLTSARAIAALNAAEGNFDQVDRQKVVDALGRNPEGASMAHPSTHAPDAQYYKLRGAEIYYGLNPVRDATGRVQSHDVVSVLNNSEHARGFATPAVMLDAIERHQAMGVQTPLTLDAWDVKNFLPGRYSRFGFDKTWETPYDPHYGRPSQTLRNSWGLHGWREGDTPPTVQGMALDSGRARTRREYLAERAPDAGGSEIDSDRGRAAGLPQLSPELPGYARAGSLSGGEGTDAQMGPDGVGRDSLQRTLDHLRGLDDYELRGLGVDPQRVRRLDTQQSTYPINERANLQIKQDVQDMIDKANPGQILPERVVFNRTHTSTEFQRGVADDYDRMPVYDSDPRVRQAYELLTRELGRQWNTLKLRVEFMPKTDDGEFQDVYGADSRRVAADIRDNNRLYVYPTAPETFGPAGVDVSDHPLLGQSPYRTASGEPMLWNDVLRAVHDAIAHGVYGATFGENGEEVAYATHALVTQDPWAIWALATETRGQNSWVNFGPQVRDGSGELMPKEARPPRSALDFAIQKTGLLPKQDLMTGIPEVDSRVRSLPSDYDGSLQPGEATAKPRTDAFRVDRGSQQSVRPLDIRSGLDDDAMMHDLAGKLGKDPDRLRSALRSFVHDAQNRDGAHMTNWKLFRDPEIQSALNRLSPDPLHREVENPDRMTDLAQQFGVSPRRLQGALRNFLLAVDDPRHTNSINSWVLRDPEVQDGIRRLSLPVRTATGGSEGLYREPFGARESLSQDGYGGAERTYNSATEGAEGPGGTDRPPSGQYESDGRNGLGQQSYYPIPRDPEANGTWLEGPRQSDAPIGEHLPPPDDMTRQWSDAQREQTGIGSQNRQRDWEQAAEDRSQQAGGRGGPGIPPKEHTSWVEAKKLGNLMNERQDIIQTLGLKGERAGISDTEIAAASQMRSDMESRMDDLDRRMDEARVNGDTNALDSLRAQSNDLWDKYTELTGHYLRLTSNNGRNLAALRMWADTAGGDANRFIRRMRNDARRDLTPQEMQQARIGAETIRALEAQIASYRSSVANEAARGLESLRGRSFSMADLDLQHSAVGVAPKKPITMLTDWAADASRRGIVSSEAFRQEISQKFGITLDGDAARAILERGQKQLATQDPLDIKLQGAKRAQAALHTKVIATTFGEFATGLYKAGLISSPRAIQAPLLGGTLSRLPDAISRVPSALYDSLLELRSGKRSVATTGALRGEFEAWSKATGKAMIDKALHGSTPEELGVGGARAKLNYRPFPEQGVGKGLNAVTGGLSHYGNKVFDLHSAMAQSPRRAAYARGLIEGAWLEGHNAGLRGQQLDNYVSEHTAVPTPEHINNALQQIGGGTPDDALYRMAEHAREAQEQGSFTNSSPATKLMGAISEAPGGALLVPFPKVPTNRLARGLEYTPAGTAYGLVRTLQFLRSGDTGLQAQASTAMGRSITGYGLAYLGWLAERMGFLSPPTPASKADRDMQQAEGEQGSSLRIGNRWWRADEVAQLAPALMGAEIAHTQDTIHNGHGQAVGTNPANAIGRGSANYLLGQIQDTPALQGPTNLMDAVQQAQQTASEGGGDLGDTLLRNKFVAGLGGAVVPSFIRDASDIADPYVRGDNSFTSKLEASTPLRYGMTPQVDALGRPILKPTGLAQEIRGLGPDQSERMNDPLTRALSQLDVPVQRPNRVTAADRPDRDVTQADADQRRAVYGDTLSRYLNEALQNPYYRNLGTDDERRRELLAVKQAARADAAGQIRDSRAARTP